MALRLRRQPPLLSHPAGKVGRGRGAVSCRARARLGLRQRLCDRRALAGVSWRGLAGRGRVSAHVGAGGAQADTRGGSAAPRGCRGAALCQGTFDVVVCNFSWHWFGPGAGEEVLRVLRPGGWLLVSAPLRRLSSAPGNRWLARRLHARRRSFRRLASQGLRIEEMASLLPGDLRTRRLESAVIEESFPDTSALLATWKAADRCMRSSGRRMRDVRKPAAGALPSNGTWTVARAGQ